MFVIEPSFIVFCDNRHYVLSLFFVRLWYNFFSNYGELNQKWKFKPFCLFLNLPWSQKAYYWIYHFIWEVQKNVYGCNNMILSVFKKYIWTDIRVDVQIHRFNYLILQTSVTDEGPFVKASACSSEAQTACFKSTGKIK